MCCGSQVRSGLIAQDNQRRALHTARLASSAGLIVTLRRVKRREGTDRRIRIPLARARRPARRCASEAEGAAAPVSVAGALLLRPDGFVAWRSAHMPAEPARELTQVLDA